MNGELADWKGILSDPARKIKYSERLKKLDASIRAFLEVDLDRAAAASSKTGPLAGCPFGVKNNIALAGFKLSCGSKMLENLVSPYSASAVLRLQAAGAVPVATTNLDEFGMGSSTENSAFFTTRNPWNAGLVPGGSSGGSAAAVAARMLPFALGSDTGGSVRQPAAFCGVYGLKPTYGVVSRYGLVAYASSLEVIGVCAASVELAQAAFEAMKGVDELDQSSLEQLPAAKKAGRRIGVLELGSELHPDVRAGCEKAAAGFKKLGYAVSQIELPSLEYCLSAYYTIATAEASANLARYTGIRYGLRPDYAENPEELVRKARSLGFGAEVKLRILLGTYVLRSGFQDQYYLRAQKIRTAIRGDFERVFAGVDFILMPVFPVPPFKPGAEGLDQFQQKLADKFTTVANLTGLPALSFPASVEGGLPVGVQLMAPAFEEAGLFEAARAYAGVFAPPVPPGF